MAQYNPFILKNNLGKIGLMIWSFANGKDTSPVSSFGSNPIIKSVGNSTTTPRDLISEDDIKITLYKLSESVAARMREYGFITRTVQVTIRQKDLFSYERQAPLPYPCADSNEIFKVVYKLVQKHSARNIPLRSLGVRGCDLIAHKTYQLSYFEEVCSIQKHERLEAAIEQLRNRFGHYAVQRGIMLKDKALSNFDPKSDHVIHPVSFLQGGN